MSESQMYSANHSLKEACVHTYTVIMDKLHKPTPG